MEFYCDCSASQILRNKKCSLPCSQDLAPRRCSQQDESSPHLPRYLLYINFNTLLSCPATPWYSQWPFYFRIFNHNFVRFYILLDALCMPCPSHISVISNIWRNVEALVLQVYPPSCCLLSLSPNIVFGTLLSHQWFSSYCWSQPTGDFLSFLPRHNRIRRVNWNLYQY